MFVDFNILNQLGSPSINSNTFANRPAAGQTGRLFVSTDTFEIYRDNGTTWDLIGGPGSSTITGTGTATQVAYFTSSQAIGSSANLYWDNANTRLGIGTNTPSSALDIHSTGIMARLNSTSATSNSLLAFQRSGSGLWRIGDNYGSGTNYFELLNTVLGINAMQVFAATNKTSWQATETYTTGQARANYFDYNLSVAIGGSFSSPNAITALGASLDLTLAGNATIPSGARSGLDAYNSIAFTGAGTLTHTQGTQIRAYSNVTAGWAFAGSAVGTITHLAGLRALFPDNSGSAVNVTNNYALLLNDQTANTGTVTYTNRWGIYQEGASDLNYMAANLLLGSTTNSGEKLQVTGNVYASGNVTFGGTLNVSNASVFQVTDAGVGTKTIVATFARTGATASGTSREAGIVFRDNAGTTLTGGITGTRDNSGGNYLGGLKFYVNSTSGTPATTFADLTNAMSITSAGNVEFNIGTGANLAPVQTGVNIFGGATSASTQPGVLTIGANNVSVSLGTAIGILQFYSNDASALGSGVRGYISSVADNTFGQNYALTFGTGASATATEKMRIDSTGNCGLGTNSPLAVANYIGLTTSGTNGSFVSLYTGATQIGRIEVNSTTDFTIKSIANVPMILGTNNTERARFTAGGNFLIGTTTDSGYKTDVAGSFRNTTDAYLNTASGFTAIGTTSSNQTPTITVPSGQGSVICTNGSTIISWQGGIPSPYTQNVQIDIVFSNWGSNNVIGLADIMVTLRQWANVPGTAFGKVFATNTASAATFSTFNTTDVTTSQCTISAASGGNYTLRITIDPTNTTDRLGVYLNVQNGGIPGISSVTISYV